jgi:hypothetical protein
MPPRAQRHRPALTHAAPCSTHARRTVRVRSLPLTSDAQSHVLNLLLSSVVALAAFYAARFVRVRFFPAKEYAVRSPSPMRHLKLNGL